MKDASYVIGLRQKRYGVYGRVRTIGLGEVVLCYINIHANEVQNKSKITSHSLDLLLALLDTGSAAQ